MSAHDLPAASTSTTTSTESGLLTGLRWMATAIAIGILIQAVLASQGFYESKPGLITGHGHLGNTLFLLAVIQTGLAVAAASKTLVERRLAVMAALVTFLIVTQIGLGYTGRSEATAMAWHLPNGVLLMGLSTVLAVTLWNTNADGPSSARCP
ncbi:MAG: hypothetical protein M3440_16250 [Chloroflexota bacterium]|nr:hypothetical protein [Chloroflexota bacterium]